jgi:hypothetical protein
VGLLGLGLSGECPCFLYAELVPARCARSAAHGMLRAGALVEEMGEATKPMSPAASRVVDCMRIGRVSDQAELGKAPNIAHGRKG